MNKPRVEEGPAGLAMVLEGIVALAREFTFRARVVPTRHTSLPQLVRETGYPQFRDEVTVDSLRGALNGRGGVLEDWLAYSSDKQVDWGWFFERDPRRPGYSVGLRSGYSLETRGEIQDPWEACAYFIKHEVEAIIGAPTQQPVRRAPAPGHPRHP